MGAILFLSRQIFFYHYEPEYYENWYYNSQWNVPSSSRGIADGELYKFVGYRLAEGENPFDINFEIPPLAKYLYGLAEKLTGNPYWISLGLFLGSTGVLFGLAKDLFKERRKSLLVTLLFVSTPFVATQVKETMLDLPLMAFYLAQVWFFVRFLTDRKWLNLALAGGLLGLATGIKPGVYTPFVLALGLLFILGVSRRKILEAFFYIGSVLGGYVLAWFCYFIQHPNPIPWLRLHEKPLRFYLSSTSGVDHLNQWRSIFLNRYQGWWQPGQTTSMGDWSLLLPIGVVVTILVLLISIKKRDWRWVYVAGLAGVFLGVNSFIPFWSRYLMPAIPLFVLMIVYFLNKKFVWLVWLLVALNFTTLFGTLASRDLPGNAQAAGRFIATRAYRELYRSIRPEDRKVLVESEFVDENERFFESLKGRNVQVEIKEVEEKENKAEVVYRIGYVTDYGEFVHEPVFEFEVVNNQWKLIWDWDYLWPGYWPGAEMKIDETETADYFALPWCKCATTAGGKWQTVYIIPRLMYDWGAHLAALSLATGDGGVEIDKRIKQFAPDDYPRFVGFVKPGVSEEEALAIKGVRLKEFEADYVVLPKGEVTDGKILKNMDSLRATRPESFYTFAHVSFEDEGGEKVVMENYLEEGEVVLRL